MKSRILVVYNICGLSNKDNCLHYLGALRTIRDQACTKRSVVISACCVPSGIRDELRSEFPDFAYCDIKDILPVNLTFNYSARKCTEKLGRYTGYVYVDSGCSFVSQNQFVDNNKILGRLNKLLLSGPYGIAGAQTNTDNGLLRGMRTKQQITKDTEVPLGYYINSHVLMYSHTIYDAYNQKLAPDIFAGHCSETVQTFICAGIGQKVVLSGSLMVDHVMSVDGPSIAFGGARPHKIDAWDNLFHSPRSIKEIIADPEAHACGFGYDEIREHLVHKPDCYDKRGNCLDQARLKRFVEQNVYLSKESFDYDKVNAVFYPPV